MKAVTPISGSRSTCQHDTVRNHKTEVGSTHCRGVHVAGPRARPVLQVVCQHVRVVLQDLPVDQVPHLERRSNVSCREVVRSLEDTLACKERHMA